MKKSVILAFCLLVLPSYIFCENKQLEKLYIVIGDNINIRSNPDIKANIIKKLKLGQTVKVIQRENKKIKIGDQVGEWVYIDPGMFKKGTTELLKGWVFDKYLAQYKDFKLVTNFMNCNIDDYEGDWLLSYEIYKNGTYKRKYLDRNEKNNITAHFCKGKLYRLKNVVIALDDTGSFEIFVISDDGILCSSHYNADGKQICSKCN
jgi:hypothetical protein